MPLQATSGAASYDAFGGGVAAVPNYIEECFSTTLYTGNGSTQTITNGIDLAGKGGMTWFKRRDGAADHQVYDTVRGGSSAIFPNLTIAAQAYAQIDSFNANGLTINNSGAINSSGSTFASWTFRKQPKFFDVVTYTGNGVAGRTVAHNLGSVPGCVIVKSTSDATIWAGYHRSLGATKLIRLNTTDAATTNATMWNDTEPTSTVFTVGNAQGTNQSGSTYVAYVFAHNAGGFGLTGTDNVISCGSFTADSSGGCSVNLGYEPQFLLTKRTDGTGNWEIYDVMRGLSQTSTAGLYANTSGAETNYGTSTSRTAPAATGFEAVNWFSANSTNIYIAIRRGPMKVPTSGTSVFVPVAQNTGANAVVTTGFPVDLSVSDYRSGGGGAYWIDRLRGSTTTSSRSLVSASTAAEYVQTSYGIGLDSNTTIVDNFNNNVISSGPYAYWNFQRAPSFFDEVCYTGTGSATTQAHNLGVAPELMIVKQRNIGGYWMVYPVQLGNKYLVLQLTDAVANAFTGLWNNTAPTSSVFSLGTGSDCNQSGGTYVAYLFATCAGVSKVFSYTGNGSSQTINCGFTAGARWILIKRTDSTGDWYVWDSARGIVSGNDPHLSLNTTAAEVTTDDTIDTDSTGFVVNQVSATNVNVSSATYIGIAIA